MKGPWAIVLAAALMFAGCARDRYVLRLEDWQAGAPTMAAHRAAGAVPVTVQRRYLEPKTLRPFAPDPRYVVVESDGAKGPRIAGAILVALASVPLAVGVGFLARGCGQTQLGCVFVIGVGVPMATIGFAHMVPGAVLLGIGVTRRPQGVHQEEAMARIRAGIVSRRGTAPPRSPPRGPGRASARAAPGPGMR